MRSGPLPLPAILVLVLLCLGGSFQATQGTGSRAGTTPVAPLDLSGTSYLAIGPSEFGPALRPLLDWKETRGVRSQFVPIERILSDPNLTGRDDQETVRNFLVQARESSTDGGRYEGIRWVLLAGDTEIIPPRLVFVNHDSEHGADDPLNYVPTDFYYAGLDGDWDLDGDDVFGEDRLYGGDEEADLEADVYVGRFAASNISEISIMVKRQLSYEQDPPAGPWARSMLLAGSLMDVPNSVDRPDTPTDEGYNEYKDNAYKVTRNITAALPESVIPYTLLDYPKIPPGGYNRLFDTLNRTSFEEYYEMGFSTAMLACHGDQHGNCTDYKGDKGGNAENYWVDSEVYLDYISARSIDNRGKVPLVYISNCGSLNYTEEDDTSLETLMLNENGGAIGVIGATTETYRGEIAPVENLTGSYGNWWLAEEFFRILYRETPHPAEALYRQKWNYEAHIWKEMQPFTPELFRAFRIDGLAYNLLGDPEGPIWLDEPRRFNVTGVNPHIVTDDSIQPLVRDLETGDPVEGAVVDLVYDNDPSFSTFNMTESNGMANFLMSRRDLSDFRLTVTHAGYLPAVVRVDVISLINIGLSNLTILPSAPTSGSEVSFKVVIKNNGSVEVRNFLLKMSLMDISSGKVITADPEFIDSLGPGSTTNETQTFVIFPGTNTFKAELRFFDDPIQFDVKDDVLVHQFIANEPISILRAGLPNPLVWDEDLPLSSTEPGMLPIWAYIIDPDTPLEDAGIKVKTVLGHLTPSIVMDDHDRPMLEISPMLNWFGNGSVEIEVTDGSTTDSALLNVTILPVPDKPQPLVYPETVLAYEDVETNFTVEFSDPDSTDLTLGSPMQYLSIAPGAHPGSFNVSLTPPEGLVGNQIITLTATDGTGLNATLQLPLRVEPTNDPPVMLGETVYEMIAGRSLTIDLKIADDGTGPYNVTAAWEFQTINANGSMITIDAPSEARRGIYYLTVNVTDSEGASSSISIRIDLDRKDRAILPITIVVIVVVTLLSLLIGYGVYSRMRERRLSENLSTVGGTGPATHELTIDDFQAGGGDYLAMPPSQLEKDLSPLGEGQAEPEEDEIVQSEEDLDGDIDDVIGEFYKD